MAKTLSFRAIGTKCAACEIILEREFAQIPGVQSVHASHEGGRVDLTVDDRATVTVADLDARVGAHGYRFETIDASAGAARPSANSWKHVGAAAVIVFALYAFAKQFGLLSYSPNVETGSGLGAVFVVGLVAALSSCTAVVSGLLVAISSAQAARNAHAPFAARIRPHLLFNGGRLAGFAALGALTGLVGSAFSLSTTANGVLVVAVALLMIGIGVNLLDVLPAGFAVRPPKFLSRRVAALADSKNPLVPAVLGAGTYFLPCGFTQSMQLLALSTGSPSKAALIMFVFALGTLPALLGIGAVTSVAKGNALRRLSRAAGAAVVVIGLSNVQNGATLLGLVSDGPRSVPVPSDVFVENGTQVLQMEITSRATYEPDTLSIAAGVPTRWEIEGAEHMGCATTLVIPKLGTSFAMSPGYNEIALAPLPAGTYPFTCSMGMSQGTLIVQ